MATFRAAAGAWMCLALASICLAAEAQRTAGPVPRPIEAGDLARLTDLDGLSVSPDGRWVAFQTRTPDPAANTYDLAWQVVPAAGGAPRRIADGGEPILPATLGRKLGAVRASPPVWSPDSRLLTFIRKDGGRIEAWLVPVEGGAARRVSNTEGDVQALQFSRDGAQLLYRIGPSEAQTEAALAEEGRNGFLFDNRFSPSYSMLPTHPADASFTDMSPGPRQSALERRQTSLLIYDLRTGATRPAGPEEAAGFASGSAASPPAGRTGVRGAVIAAPNGMRAWTEARDPARQGGFAPVTVVAQPAADKAPLVCAAASCTGQSIAGMWWTASGELLFARGEGDLLQDHALYSWRPGGGAPRLLLRTANKFLSSGEWTCSLAGRQLICFYEEPARPRRVVSIDTSSGAVKDIFDPNPQFRFDLGEAPQRRMFETRSGVRSYGYLVRPPGPRTQRLPLVVVTYRCSGFQRGGSGDEYPVFPLAARGFAVLCFSVPDIDYKRLETMDWNAYTNWARGPGDPEKRQVQEGIEDAIDQLDREGVIDPGRVAITGLSFGGETVLYALFNMPRLRAAIASGTEYGPASNFLNGLAGRGSVQSWGLSDPDSPRWDALSITRNAEKVKAPLLLNVNDHELLGALHPFMSLRDAGKPVEMFVYPDAYHLKWQPVQRLAVYRRNIDWLDFWLRDVEDPDPAKAAQYARWRAMRAEPAR